MKKEGELVMVLSTYQTVKGKGEHEIIIQKSRFIAFFDRVETEEAAQAFIEKIKKRPLECQSQLFSLFNWRTRRNPKSKRRRRTERNRWCTDA